MKIQLKLFVILVFALTVFNSCSSESSDESNTTDGELLGVWNLVEFDYSGSSVTDFQGQNFTTTYDAVGSNIDATMEITENPNDLIFSGSYDINLVFSFAGQTQTQVYPVEDVESISSWTRSGDILTVNGELVTVEGADLGEAESQDYTIDELTSSTLVLTAEVAQIVENQGLESTVTIEVYMKFTR